jgi:hypothetical protein
MLPHQLDRCDICGKKTHKIDLVRTNVDFLAAGGYNDVQQSSADAGFTCSATPAGNISYGNYCDRARVSVGDDNTTSIVHGIRTWDGAGVLRTNGVIAGSWTSLVFAADVGPYEQETSPEMTFDVGLIDSDGSNKELVRSFTISAGMRIWFTINIADLPASKSSGNFACYIETASSNKWWADRLQIIKNATSLHGQAYVPTSGSTIDRIDTPMMTVRKVCKSCFEKPWKRSEQYNRSAEQRTEDPVAVDIQEV